MAQRKQWIDPMQTMDSLNSQTARIDGTEINVGTCHDLAVINCYTGDVRFIRAFDGPALFSRIMLHVGAELFAPTERQQYFPGSMAEVEAEAKRRHPNDVIAQVKWLLIQSQQIAAIKLLRAEHGWGLFRAKKCTDYLRAGYTWDYAERESQRDDERR